MEGETSCATAQVAGVAALLLQKNPALTPSDVKGYLVAGAEKASMEMSVAAYPARPAHVGTGTGFAAGTQPGSATAAGLGTGTALVNALESWHLVS
jgi:subtilisin family serine protease